MDSNPPNQERWWKNRRRMAWGSFIMAVIETILLGLLGAFNPKALAAMGVAIAWSYGLWGSTIAAYIGFATWADVAATRK